MRRILTVGMMVLLVGLFCPLAYGEDSSQSDWAFGLAPMYLWAVSIDGDQTVKGNEVDLDVPFSDIFDNLNGALTFHFEGLYKSRWGFFTDLTYNLVGLVDYKPWKHVSLFGGYRLLYQDYSTGSGSSKFAFDATMQGPVLGMNITW